MPKLKSVTRSVFCSHVGITPREVRSVGKYAVCDCVLANATGILCMKSLRSEQGGAVRNCGTSFRGLSTPSTADSEGVVRTSVDGRALQWYAIFTMPRHEKSVDSHFDFQRIVHFLPAYEKVNTWRNRRTVRVKMPLFSRYLFARFDRRGHGRVLQTPGVLQIVGTESGPTPVPDAQIDFLRMSIAQNDVEPYPHLALGRRVRIKTGLLAGVEGILVRRENRNRFVLTLSSIQQSVSIDAGAVALETL